MIRDAYSILSEAYYGPTILGLRMRDRVVAEVTIMRECLDDEGMPDGVEGEFVIAWHDLGREVVARIEAFSDAWPILRDRADLIARLADLGQGATVEQVVAVLDELGFHDSTQRARYPTSDEVFEALRDAGAQIATYMVLPDLAAALGVRVEDLGRALGRAVADGRVLIDRNSSGERVARVTTPAERLARMAERDRAEIDAIDR